MFYFIFASFSPVAFTLALLAFFVFRHSNLIIKIGNKSKTIIFSGIINLIFPKFPKGY